MPFSTAGFVYTLKDEQFVIQYPYLRNFMSLIVLNTKSTVYQRNFHCCLWLSHDMFRFRKQENAYPAIAAAHNTPMPVTTITVM